MNPDLLKLVALAVGAIISAPFVMASVRAFFFFGQMSQAVKNADAKIGAVEKLITDFIAEMRQSMLDHETRLTTIEAERRIEATTRS